MGTEPLQDSRNEPEELLEFSYISDALEPFLPEDLLRLARQSWSCNLRAGITGELRLIDGRFHQTIEGPASAMLDLLGRLLADPRHSGILVTAFGPVSARRFRDWTVPDLRGGESHGHHPLGWTPRLMRGTAA